MFMFPLFCPFFSPLSLRGLELATILGSFGAQASPHLRRLLSLHDSLFTILSAHTTGAEASPTRMTCRPIAKLMVAIARQRAGVQHICPEGAQHTSPGQSEAASAAPRRPGKTCSQEPSPERARQLTCSSRTGAEFRPFRASPRTVCLPRAALRFALRCSRPFRAELSPWDGRVLLRQ